MRSRIRESKRLNTYHIINWTKRRLYFFNEEYFYIIILLENILSYILMNINSQINVRLRYRILRFYHLEQSPILYFTGEYLNLYLTVEYVIINKERLYTYNTSNNSHHTLSTIYQCSFLSSFV